MAVIIAVGDVKEGFDTTVSDIEIEMLIEIIDEADTCLDANNVSDAKQTILKIYGVRHMLQLQANSAKGVVKSERAPSGASRSYGEWQGTGIEATPFGLLLKQIDVYGCVVNLIQDGPKLAIWSVGRNICS